MDPEATSDTGPISGEHGQHSKKGSEMATNEMPLVPREHELCEAVTARCFDTVVSILGEPNRAFSQKVLDDCLLDACGLYKNSDQYLLIELLRSGASIKAVSEDGWTPVLIAVKNVDMNLLSFLLQKGADVNAVTAEGDSALTLSVRPNRSLDIIKLLLQLEEIDNNHRNHQGYTALMKAVELRDFEVMKLLIDDHKCNNRETLAVSEDNLDSDETIINSFGQELYDVARPAGMVKVIKLLLHLKQGDSPLLEAALIPDVELVKILIDSQFCSIQKEDSSHTTFLQRFFQIKKQRNLAVGDVDLPIIKLLLENGAAVNKSEKSWSSTDPPVITAVEAGSLGLVQLMCTYGAKLDVTTNYPYKTPLDVAAESGKADILQYLLSNHTVVSTHGEEVTYTNSALHLCLGNGHTDCAEILLKHGYKIDVPCAAQYAIDYNKPAYLKFLLERFPSGVHIFLFSTKQKGNTIFTMAVRNDYVNIINNLVTVGVQMPDFLLSHAKSAAMVQLLVSNGASVNRRATTGNPVLLTLIRSGKNKTSVAQIVKILLEKGANVNDCNLYGVTPLIAAAQTWDSSELLNTLLLHGADVHKRDNQGMTAFLYAVEKNYTENAKLLIQLEGNQKVDIDMQDTSGSFPLMLAATYNNKTITDLLLDRGADVNVQNDNGDTALTLVARCGDADTLKKIIERGADINHQNKNGYSALMYAAKGYSVSNLDVLLLHGAKVNIKDNSGNTALLHAVQQDRAEITKRLLEHEGNQKVDIDVQDTSCSTALVLAVKKRNKAITDLLLARGANVNIEDNSGDTALTLVVRNGDSDTLKKIIERGADINHRNKGGYTALMLAGRRELYSDRDLHLDLGHLKALLLNAADVNIKDNMGNTALLLALEQRLTETAKFLIEHEGGQKVDLDAQNTSGSTALISAVKQRLKIITDLLIDRGANVNVEDNNGDTALTLATSVNDLDTLKKIIERGADINHQNKEGHSALMTASRNLDKDSMDALLNAGADVNTAIALLFETKPSYKKSTKYLLMDYLRDKVALSSYLNPGVLFDLIQSNQLKLVSKLISNGFGPHELSSEKYLHHSEERMFFPVVSPFILALLYSELKLARYFDGNWFLSTSDIQLQAKHNLVKEFLERKISDECMDILDEFCSQPMSLLKLSFVAVSSAVGCVPGREERVEKLPLPAIIKDKLLFKEQEVQLDIPESACLSRESTNWPNDYDDIDSDD